MQTAIILTGGLLDNISAKTAHGLIRGSERFQIIGIIDTHHAGKDAGEVLDGQKRNIPVYPDFEAFLSSGQRADCCILGIANAGGRLPDQLRPDIEKALRNGISVVSGMHEFLIDQPRLAELAAAHGAQLIDVRRPKPASELHFWSGAIDSVSCPIIAVMGTDCAVGKRTTAKFLVEEARSRGLKAEMIYTGQTGWMQGWKYGLVLDATLNDFVSGEIEHAIVSCFEAERPDVIFLEGQAALRNPSGPCGSEFLVSGGADGVILVHPAGRTHYKGWADFNRVLPPVEEEMELVRMYGKPTLGIAVNTANMDADTARSYQEEKEAGLGIPVVLPLKDGVAKLLDAILAVRK
ncbi:MAG: DUF1611 domain-containing protein [Bacteroidota bacterium]